MTARWRAEVACDAVYALGEGPLWDGPRGRALWVDILAGTVHEGRLENDRIVPGRSWTPDRMVGAVVVGRSGDLLVAGTEDLLARIDEGVAVLTLNRPQRRNAGM